MTHNTSLSLSHGEGNTLYWQKNYFKPKSLKKNAPPLPPKIAVQKKHLSHGMRTSIHYRIKQKSSTKKKTASLGK
jgi:hypothetical protein